MTEIGPNAPARIKRFYKTVSVEPCDEGFAVMLDGCAAKTSTGAALITRSARLAEAVAGEWRVAGEMIDLAAMPLSRLLAAAIDHGEAMRGEWTEQILRFLKSDLLCYRAEQPQALYARQAALWDSYLDWARCALGIDLQTALGVMSVAQPGEAVAAARREMEAASPEVVLCVKTATELTGSAVLGLAVWKRAFPPEAIFAASRIDETFQKERWGTDAGAEAAEARASAEFRNVARFLTLLED